jgi:predicted nucleotidyltransferase
MSHPPNIQYALQKIEADHQVQILLAVESGSRAWGFASTDSDWDVRFIYIHQPKWYLQIDQPKDTMEFMLEGDLDLVGWDLQKALRLFRRSNPTLLEWLHSPIVYQVNTEFREALLDLLPEAFNPKACMYRHLSIVKKNYQQYLGREVVNLKKYFYSFRSILSARYIQLYGEMPPIVFSELINSNKLPTSIHNRIEALLEQKQQVEESADVPRDPVLNDYLQNQLQELETYVGQLPVERHSMTPQLNSLFLKAWNKQFNS